MLPCMIWYFTWRKLREKRGISVALGRPRLFAHF